MPSPRKPSSTSRNHNSQRNDLMFKKIVFIFAVLLFAAPAFAQTPPSTVVVPSTVAPPLSFCFGASTTCVVPDFGLQAVNYDVTNKKWNGGITSIAVGYALLLASDKPYASGVALHTSFNFNQAAPSFFAPT